MQQRKITPPVACSVVVTIYDTPRSPAWDALWRRLLAPNPAVAATPEKDVAAHRKRPTRVEPGAA